MAGVYGMGMVGMVPPNTWNGEPCPVHGANLPPPHHHHHHHQQPMTMSAYPAYPPMYSSMSMRRAASIHELAIPALMPPPALLPPPPQAIYGQAPDPRHQFMIMAPPPSSLGHAGPARMARMARPGPSSLPPMPPASLLPPMQRRQLVVNGKHGHPEPLPVRDAPPLPPKIPPSDAASKATSAKRPFSYNSCCQGNVVVLWVILAIIALGIVMAVVFSFAFQWFLSGRLHSSRAPRHTSCIRRVSVVFGILRNAYLTYASVTSIGGLSSRTDIKIVAHQENKKTTNIHLRAACLACDHSLWLFTSLHSSCSLLPFDADVGRDVHLLRSIQFFSFLLLLMCVILHPKNQINK